MSTIKALVIGGVAGGIMTALAFTFLIPSSSSTANNEQNEEKQPLYWVAPMDPNYRRDEQESLRWAWISFLSTKKVQW